jgi:hypothetical protein
MSGNNPGYSGVPEVGPDDKEHRRKLARAVNLLNQGKMNAVIANFTLTPNASSSTITDNRITNNSFIDFMPITANAAAAKQTLYVSQQMASNAAVQGNATVQHANNSQADRTFRLLIIG